MFLLDLLNNVALLVTLSVLLQLVSRRWTLDTLTGRLIAGVLFGVVAIIGMATPARLSPGVIFDGRSIVLAAAGFIAGPIVATIAGVAAAAYRIWLGGAGATVGVLVIAEAAALGTGLYYLRRRYPAAASGLALVGLGVVVHAIMVALMFAFLGEAVARQIALPVLTAYPLATAIICRFLLDQEERLTARSARKLAEESLQRYKYMVDQADEEIYLVKPDGTLVFVNEAAAQSLGFTVDELLARGVSGIDADFGTRFQEHFGELKAGELAPFRTSHTAKDGSTVTKSLHSSYLRIGDDEYVCAFGHDITAQERMESALRESEARFRSLADNGRALIWTAGTDKLCDYFNRPWLDFTGRTLEQELGNGWTEGVHPDDFDRCLETYVTAFDRREAFTMIYRLRRADGAYRWIIDDGVPRYDHAGTFIGYVGHCLDVTEQRDAEDEVRRMNESLEQLVHERTEELATANIELAEANEAKTRFLRSMSHELRTPLNSVIGFSGTMLQGLTGDVNDEQRRQLQMINHAGRHLLELINDVLDLSRIEAGKVEMHAEHFELEPLVADAVESVAMLAKSKGLALRMEGSNPGLRLHSDPVRVRQILLNLLSNAVKFTEVGTVVVQVTGTPEGAVFTVVDTGPGIPVADHERIFGEFTQRELQSTPRHEGTGLGLAISSRLATLLGGTITVESCPGAGSKFTVTLPNLVTHPSEGDV